MSVIQIRFANNPEQTINCPCGTAADSFIDLFNVPPHQIAALRVNNEIQPLNTNLMVNSMLEPVLLDSREGAMIYRRSLAFLLVVAAKKHSLAGELDLGHSLGNSYYYTFSGPEEGRQQKIALIAKELQAIVKEDAPIQFKQISYIEALELFQKNSQRDTQLLLEQRSSSIIKVNECKGCMDLYVEPLVMRAGLLDVFEITPYRDGFLLRFPGIGAKTIEPFVDEPKIFEVYDEYKKWGRIIGVRVVGELNSLVAGMKTADYIRIVETHQARKLSDIAHSIYKMKGTVKMALIAGPSSSGKTTSAKRLAIELMVLGFKPVAISLDSYYVGTERTPKDENGQPDFECLEAIDVPYINEQLAALCRGGEVTIPDFDFKTGTRRAEGSQTVKMDERTILIVEGIHALNEAISRDIEKAAKFKIYVSALTQLNLDEYNRIPTSDNRLLRRIVRDNQFRGKNAAGTIKMWPNVQAGERKHIFPFQNSADIAFNSALDYEIPVLKYFADPLLRAVKPDVYEYAEASRLLSFLENFAPIPPQYVPGNSILREFIGDSEFKY
ncbi:MAG: nucleoside kinase [Spirochaetes bacterium]|nr:nucleoside kinase [Spirochaetota bacterium]